jgi:hypothetical protein
VIISQKNLPTSRVPHAYPCWEWYCREKGIILNTRDENRRVPSTKWNGLERDHVSKHHSVLDHWHRSKSWSESRLTLSALYIHKILCKKLRRSFGVSKSSPGCCTRPCPCECYGKEKCLKRNEGRRTPPVAVSSQSTIGINIGICHSISTPKA